MIITKKYTWARPKAKAPTERSLELGTADATIVDVETGREMRTQPYQMQASYQAAVNG